jgi:hypothetical protein
MFECLRYVHNYRKFNYWLKEFDSRRGKEATDQAYILANKYGENVIQLSKELELDFSRIKKDLERIIMEWGRK